MAKPPLALSAVSIAADGSETIWWSGDRRAYNRPQQLSFRTKIGEGFSDASATLARRIDRDYNDLQLYNGVVFVADDGQTAYEGRIGANPRSTSGGHSILVQCAGWMEHARDAKFTEVYADPVLGGWGDMPFNRKVSLVTANVSVGDFSWTTEQGGLVCALPSTGSNLTNFTNAEVWYVAPKGNQIAKVWFNGTDKALPASWEAPKLFATDTDDSAATDTYSVTFDSTLREQVLTTARRYVYFREYSNGTASTPAAGASRRISPAAVYGNHGLTLHSIDSGPAPGLYASDVITDIAQRFCPELNTAGVQGTSLPIPYIVFSSRTTPFDAFLLLNGPHGWQLAVWEGKTLHFEPYDLSDYDWQVRMDQPGVDLSLQGDTTTDLANYAVVEFDNVLTGQRDSVSPADSSDLEDLTVDHPANAHGLNVELTVPLTFPSTPDMAIQFGRSYLAEFNRPKTRGQITVQGHILDRAGHWWQGWKPRAGETIAVVDHPNDAPRLITETSWDHPSRTMTISTDNGELNRLDAVVDRIQTALVANNLR